MLVLWQWNKFGKFPLLGPQNSVLPLNQSSWYFYILYPGFLLFSAQPISANYTLATLYIVAFMSGLWLFRKERGMRGLLMISFFLVSIHPQFVAQNRTVSNPSFVGLFLMISIISFARWLDEGKMRFLFVYAFALALAVSFSYSAAPVLLATFIYVMFTRRKIILKTALMIIVSLMFINLTTLAFEAKHNFLILRNLLSRGIRVQNIENISINSRLGDFVNYGFSLGSGKTNLIAVISLAVLVAIALFSKKTPVLSKRLGILLSLTFILSLVLPTQIFPHYIFGFTTLLFLFIASLPSLISLPIVCLLIFLYLGPIQVASYFAPSPRSVGQMESCFKKVCQEFKEPMYVTVQANFHPYHTGPEHRFLMKKMGCEVKNIEDASQTASIMSVVLDGSDYISGKTVFSELSTFGKASELKRFSCLPNFGVVVLKKE